MRYASCFAKEKTLEECGEHDVIHADARVKSEPERRIPFLRVVAAMIQWTRPGAEKKMSQSARAHTRESRLLILSLTSFVRIPSVLRKKRPRRVVPSRRFERVQFFRRPSIHVCAFHRRDVHSERSVHPGAIETHEHAKRLRRPLRVGRVAIEAQLVPFLTEERVEQRVALVLRRHILLLLCLLCLSFLFCVRKRKHTHTHTQHTRESRSARFFSRVKWDGWVPFLFKHTHVV